MSEQPLTDSTLPKAMVAPEEEEEDRVNIDEHQDEDTENSSGDDDDDDYEEEEDEDEEVVSSSSIRHLFFAESLIHTGRCWWRRQWRQGLSTFIDCLFFELNEHLF